MDFLEFLIMSMLNIIMEYLYTWFTCDMRIWYLKYLIL
jgi:hypothetical protein